MNNSRQMWAQMVFPLLLLIVLTMTAVALTLYGAKAYQHNVNTETTSYDRSTAGLYIERKVRFADARGQISLGEFGDGDALYLKQTIDDVDYDTILYTYEDSLCELFILHGDEVDPSAGTKILDATSMHLARTGSLLEVTLNGGNDKEQTVYVAVRSGGGEDE